MKKIGIVLHRMSGGTCSAMLHIEQVLKNLPDLILKDDSTNYRPTHTVFYLCRFQSRKQDVWGLYTRPEVGWDSVQHGS